MIESKMIEIRDRATRIDVVATLLPNSRGVMPYEEMSLMQHNGYNVAEKYVIVSKLDGAKTALFPYDWGDDNRTMVEAHKYIADHFDEIPHCWTLDVETILGEKLSMKVPERYNSDQRIQFLLNPIIELSDVDVAIDYMKTQYKLEVQYCIEENRVVVLVTKDSISNCSVRFYEVLRDYLRITY